MKTVQVKDKHFSLFIKAEDIEKAVTEIANRINEDYHGKKPVFVIILNGAFVFAASLLKKIKLDCEVTFMKLSSYKGTRTSSKVMEVIGIDKEIEGKPVIIVEDIVDTGITMEYILRRFRDIGIEDVRLAVLLFKPNVFRKDFKIDYLGMEIPDDFIVGYGLDYDDFGRNYPDIYKIIE